jgi:hypothetical protein
MFKNSNSHLKYLLVFSAVIVCSVVVFINLMTAATFPSWFDEAYYANVSFNEAVGRGRILSLVPGYENKNINIYGPVFFWIQAALIESFGLHAFIFRLPSLVAGYFGTLCLGYLLLQHGVHRFWAIVYIFVTFIDVSFNRNLVSGRMDLLAFGLVTLAAALASNSSPNNQFNSSKWILVGVLSSLAFLTTPRSLFLLPLVAVFGASQLMTQTRQTIFTMHAWRHVVIGLISFCVPVIGWIVYLGGATSFVGQFTGDQVMMKHISPSLFRSFYDNVGITILLVLLVPCARLILRSELLIGLISTYFIFSVFVAEIGPYAGMIMPIVLAAIVAMLSYRSFSQIINIGIISLLSVPGVALLTLRGADLIVNHECRDAPRISMILGRLLNNTQTKAVAPAKYFFLLESPDLDLVTAEYATTSVDQLYESSQIVISSASNEKELLASGFRRAEDFRCTLVPMLFLPATFYQRSVFSESVFVKESE